MHKKDLIHFIYPVMNLVLNLVQKYVPILENEFIEDIRFISLIVFFLFYLMLSFNVLYKNLWNESLKKSIAIAHYLLIRNWTVFMFVIATFLVFRVLFSLYSEKLLDELFRAHNYSVLVIMPWLLLYGKILINPEILHGYPKLKKRLIKIENNINFTDHVWVFDLKDISNPQDKILSDSIEERVVPYITEIENFVEKENPFRTPKFSFADFARAIHIPTSHMYYIFKYHAIVTFSEYINYCRIKDALKLINDGDLNTLTLEGLASKVGFSSYNSFLTAFKEQTNQSPKDYLSSRSNMAPLNINLAFK
ncbi:helix-turn-helix domain-containing protein [Confluentibacter sediminis]|uniref:helix-turn-helix domain-containing protein n=1 Tax=Confluentibacter sediminis TaxID=2219045 RepID=UPI0013A69FD8|nr:AraC family transcriptional regulator [Confluentibacter sediminis]